MTRSCQNTLVGRQPPGADDKCEQTAKLFGGKPRNACTAVRPGLWVLTADKSHKWNTAVRRILASKAECVAYDYRVGVALVVSPAGTEKGLYLRANGFGVPV